MSNPQDPHPGIKARRDAWTKDAATPLAPIKSEQKYTIEDLKAAWVEGVGTLDLIGQDEELEKAWQLYRAILEADR